MSFLKKVSDTVETECGKSFAYVVLWSDGMDTKFQSKFIFQPLAGTMFLNKSLCWYYNEGHHGKVPSMTKAKLSKTSFPKSKVRPDWGPYTQRIF